MSLRRTAKYENRRMLRAGPRPAAGHGPRREQSYKVIF